MHFFLPNLKENRYSFRVRGTLLLEYLDDTHGYISDKADIKHNDKRLFIFGKAFDQNILNTCKKKNAKFIVDISDYKINIQNNYELYCEAAKYCKCFTTTCKYLAKILEKNFNKRCVIIEDPTERNRISPIIHTISKYDTVKLVCYGARKNIQRINFDTILKQLNNVCKVDLQVITNKQNQDPTWWHEWSFAVQNTLVKQADAVLLPIFISKKLEHFVKSKGNNRPIDSIQQGKFVICNNAIPSYDKLKNYISIGNLDAGLDFFINNPKKVYKKIVKGQKYIDKYHSPYQITQQWLDLERKYI